MLLNYYRKILSHKRRKMAVPDHKKQRAREKIVVFTDILKRISSLSTSSRLKVSCIILKKDFTKIASFGYNGNYFNAPINESTGTEEESLEPGKDGFIHAEQNALAKFREHDPENYIALITHSPCKNCAKLLVNSGFKWIYWVEDYRETTHLSEIFERCEVGHGNVERFTEDYVNGNIV
jgi:dCMP deaminase